MTQTVRIIEQRVSEAIILLHHFQQRLQFLVSFIVLVLFFIFVLVVQHDCNDGDDVTTFSPTS